MLETGPSREDPSHIRQGRQNRLPPAKRFCPCGAKKSAPGRQLASRRLAGFSRHTILFNGPRLPIPAIPGPAAARPKEGDGQIRALAARLAGILGPSSKPINFRDARQRGITGKCANVLSDNIVWLHLQCIHQALSGAQWRAVTAPWQNRSAQSQDFLVPLRVPSPSNR